MVFIKLQILEILYQCLRFFLKSCPYSPGCSFFFFAEDIRLKFAAEPYRQNIPGPNVQQIVVFHFNSLLVLVGRRLVIVSLLLKVLIKKIILTEVGLSGVLQ